MVIEQVFNYMQLNNLVGICLELVDFSDVKFYVIHVISRAYNCLYN